MNFYYIQFIILSFFILLFLFVKGIFCSKGKKILFVDADGATRFSDLANVEKGLENLHEGKNGMAISVGSRAHLQDEAVAQVTELDCMYLYIFN